jgi:hypothetical protein
MTPRQLYDEVCRVYFPGWIPWEMVYNPGLLIHGHMGYCNVKDRKIGLCIPLKFVLVHEICHAITTKKHGEAWQRRMLKVIEKARAIEPELARALETDLNERLSNIDTPICEIVPQILDAVKSEANYYYDNPEELDLFLIECGIFRELNELQYQRIHRKALKEIELARHLAG